MNSRYTFKAKRKDNEEWVYGFLIIENNHYYILDGRLNENFENLYEIIPETLCACTGLQDIEGNYIFENDILVNHCHYKVLVKFGEYEYLGLKHYGFYIQDVEFSDVFNLWGAGCKLIGNKYDNPELLD